MAAAVTSRFNPFTNSGCSDADMESWIDFSAVGSPLPSNSKTNSKSPAMSSTSTITSPATTVMPLDQQDDLQTPAKPSHEYQRYKQQTGLPSDSVPGLQSINRSAQGSHEQVFSNSGTGLDDFSLMGGDGLDNSWSTDLNLGMNIDMDFSSAPMPAFFFPSDSSQTNDFVDPSAITAQEEQQTRRVFPGMHQQQAALAAKAQAQALQQQQQQEQLLQQRQRALSQQQQQLQQQQQQQQQQQRQHNRSQSRRSASNPSTDARTEETIARVVDQIRKSSQNSNGDQGSPGSSLPHIVKMRKDEEDMDDDERLLASEEGKKLSSKERRQLRNKVSARAFRSRRKEYIGQLEGEVAAKSNECNDLKMQNAALMEENRRSRTFIEKLLRHPAFTPFLEDLSREEASQPKMSNIAPQISSTAASKDPNPFPVSSQQSFDGSSGDNLQVGMAMVPEPQLDLSTLNLSTNWNMPNVPFNMQQPQVFAVTELPEGPAAPVDVDAISGKGLEAYLPPVTPAEEEVKHDYPVVDRPAAVETEKSVQEKAVRTEVEEAFDNNPDFALYSNLHKSSPASSAPVTTTPPHEVPESIFGDADPDKVFAHFQLFVSDDCESQHLMERFEMLCSSAEPVYQRLVRLTSHLGS